MSKTTKVILIFGVLLIGALVLRNPQVMVGFFDHELKKFGLKNEEGAEHSAIFIHSRSDVMPMGQVSEQSQAATVVKPDSRFTQAEKKQIDDWMHSYGFVMKNDTLSIYRAYSESALEGLAKNGDLYAIDSVG